MATKPPTKGEILDLANNDALLKSHYGGLTLASIRQNLYVLFVAAFAVTGALCFGIDQGLMSVILVMKQFQTKYPELATGAPSQGFHKGLVTALLELGAFFGAFLTPHISDHLGRRRAMRAGCVFFLVGAAIQTGAPTYDVMVAGRFVGGIGIGLLSSTMSVYVAEIAPPSLRGSLLDLNELFVVAGVVAAYWLCFGTRLLEGDVAFRLPFGLQMIPGAVLFVALTWLPESPRWKVMTGKPAEALAVLARLRGRSEDDRGVLAEWVGMQAEVRLSDLALESRHPTLVRDIKKKDKGVDGDSDGSDDVPAAKRLDVWKSKAKLDLVAWADTWKGNVWRRTLISVLLGVFQQLVGINALIYYAPSMIEAFGFSYEDQLVHAGIINVTQLVGTIISIPLMDTVGRKPLIIFGALGMTVTMVIVGVLLKLFSDDWPSHGTEAKVALAMLNIYMVIFGTTWGPVPWAMPSELFGSSLRARGVAWSVMAIWLFNFIVGLIVPPMLDSIGWGTFIFFAAFSALAGIWATFCVHETKGKSLEQIDSFFKNRSRRGAGGDDEDLGAEVPVATKEDQLRALLTGSSRQEECVRQYYLADFAMDASKGAFRVDSDSSSKVGAQHAENA